MTAARSRVASNASPSTVKPRRARAGTSNPGSEQAQLQRLAAMIDEVQSRIQELVASSDRILARLS